MKNKKNKKVEKSCENCAVCERLPRMCKTYGEVCDKWIFEKATCNRCINLESCFTLGKPVAKDYLCINFKKRKDKWDDAIWTKYDELRKNGSNVAIIHNYADENENYEEDEFNANQLVDDIIKSDFDPRILDKVDDRDIPRANNPIQFLMDKNFLNIKPFPRQLQIFSEFWAAYCPYCSDLQFIRYGVKVDTKLEDILDKMVLYENGVCPKCGKTKYDAITDGLHNYYQTLVGCCGQRCVTGNTLILTEKGIMYMKDIASLHENKEGFQPYKGPKLVLENGMITEVESFYTSKKEEIYKAELNNGLFIKGTHEHPILTYNGKFVKLSELQKGDIIPVIVGQNSWGLFPLSLKESTDKTKKVYNDWFKSEQSKHHKAFIKAPEVLLQEVDADIALLLGLWVAEGYSKKISNIDPLVLNFCKTQIERLYGQDTALIGEKECAIRSKFNTVHFNELLDNQIEDHCTSEYKHIPRHIMESPKEVVCGFLRGLFEGDGYVETKVSHVGYTTISKRLITELQIVFANLGIFTTIRVRKTRQVKGAVNQVIKNAYTLYIEGERNLTIFRNNVNFFSDKKKEALQKAIEFYQNRTLNMPFWFEKFPQLIKDEYLDIIKSIDDYLHLFRYSNKNKVTKKGYGLLKPIGLTVIFDKNSDFKRIFSENVALSRRRIENTNNILVNSKWWNRLPLGIRVSWLKFYEKYKNPKVAYIGVKSVTICKEQYTYDFTIPNQHRFMGNGIINHNSGKSVSVGIACAIQTYNYLVIPNIHKLLGLLPSVVLHGTFVGLRYTDAYDNLWEPYRDNVTKSPWFKQYNEFLKQTGKEIGEELIQERESFVYWTYKKIYVYPEGPDKRKLRGKTRFLASADEIGWFNGGEDAIMLNFDEVHKSLSNSLMTIRPKTKALLKEYPDVPNALDFYISSPSSKLDPIMRMYKLTQGSTVSYGFHYPTWEMNPNIKKEDLAEQYRVNPIEADRDFGANPPFASSPYISSLAAILPLFRKDWANTIKIVRYNESADSLGARLQYPTIDITNPIKAPCVVSCDAGYNNNSFAITISHWFKDATTKKAVLATSGVLEIIPEPHPLDYVGIYKHVITPILKQYNVKMVVFDRWQSINLKQQIYQDFKVETDQYSVEKQDFIQLRDKIYAGEWLFCGLEKDIAVDDLLKLERNLHELIDRRPVAHMLLQFLTSKDTGRIVTKGDETSDDILRSAILGTAIMLSSNHGHKFDGPATNMKSKYIGKSLGSYVSMGGSNSGGSDGAAISKLGCTRPMKF